MKQKNGKKTACELEKEYAMEGISEYKTVLHKRNLHW